MGVVIANALAESGAQVVINGTNEELVRRRVQELLSKGCLAIGCPFDVTEENAVETGVAEIRRQIGSIDILVNNAGMQRRGPLHEIKRADWTLSCNST